MVAISGMADSSLVKNSTAFLSVTNFVVSVKVEQGSGQSTYCVYPVLIFPFKYY